MAGLAPGEVGGVVTERGVQGPLHQLQKHLQALGRGAAGVTASAGLQGEDASHPDPVVNTNTEANTTWLVGQRENPGEEQGGDPR